MSGSIVVCGTRPHTTRPARTFTPPRRATKEARRRPCGIVRAMVDDPLLGRTVLGKYRIERIIGSGGMGTVYEAEDLRLGRPVAIKVLRPAAGDFGDMGRRFRREARTIAQVTHPNLVTLLEFDLLDDGTPAMVMERVEGGSLRELLQRRPVTVDEVVEILRQSLSALGACHEAGIIHRDLKPGNLLV